MSQDPKTQRIFYKRSHFATHLPSPYLYTPSHAWLFEETAGVWRVGLTKFATRMLGEMVDHGFEVDPKAPVEKGEIIGWLEGFKAISDLYCPVTGSFLEGNPTLSEDISVISSAPYTTGWLYRVQGVPDDQCTDVQTYIALLDATIDKMMEHEEG